VDGQALPFTPAGRAQYQKNMADLTSGAAVDNAVYLCSAQGLPRAMGSRYPLQIVVTPGQFTMLFEENRVYRIVKDSDRHADPADWDPSYMGEGIAHWNDDGSLRIDSTNFKSAQMYLDATGVPASDQLHVSEQLTLRNGGTQLEDLMTIDDPGIFTRPWTVRRQFTRHHDVELKTDWVCGEPHRALAGKKP
jgi:hypothetical protein